MSAVGKSSRNRLAEKELGVEGKERGGGTTGVSSEGDAWFARKERDDKKAQSLLYKSFIKSTRVWCVRVFLFPVGVSWSYIPFSFQRLRAGCQGVMMIASNQSPRSGK